MKLRILITIFFIGQFCTAQPVIKVYDINPGPLRSDPANLYISNAELYFFAHSKQTYGAQLWKLENNSSPKNLIDIPSASSVNSHVLFDYKQILDYNGTLYFTARYGNTGIELWKYDYQSPPQLVRDIKTGKGGSSPFYLTTSGEDIYFSASDSSEYHLWRYNILKDTTVDINKIAKGFDPKRVKNITSFGGKLYFNGHTDNLEYEIFYYDPVADSIGALTNIVAPPGSTTKYVPNNMTVIGNIMYFAARTQPHGMELYKYDGVQPPVRITDINPGADDGLNLSGAHINAIVEYNGEIFFPGLNSKGEDQLYKYGPASGQTNLVTVINPTGYSRIQELIVYNNRLYFSARGGADGHELWQYDTISKAKLVKDINPGPAHSYPQEMTILDNKLFFTANDPITTGREIYSLYDTLMPPPPPASITDVKKEIICTLYPNPVIENAHLQFALQTAEKLSVTITDMSGRVVYKTLPMLYSEGQHTIDIAINNMQQGIYVCALKNEGRILWSGQLKK